MKNKCGILAKGGLRDRFGSFWGCGLKPSPYADVIASHRIYAGSTPDLHRSDRPHHLPPLSRYPSGMLSELGGAMGAFLEDVIASLPQDGHKAAQWKVGVRTRIYI